MRAFSCLVFIALAYTIEGLPASHIVGGTDAPLGKYPYQVALKFNSSFYYCGGSIINKRYVLTAANCLYGFYPEEITVHAGTIYLNETGDAYQPESAVWYSDDAGVDDDIALIRLNRDIIYSDVVKPIPLAQEDIAVTDFPCVVAGWGVLQLNGPTPNVLQEITLKVYPHDKCKLKNSKVTDNHICTLSEENKGLCIKDAGSALVANGVQIGIASYVGDSVGCTAEGLDVFVSVYACQDWIKEHMIDVD
ncbi:chymotrypsin-2 [Monomorium pharaonis]|uniref:chymotrypsin-2 n=1 Tax=Monomorium pharaonis TaxID=307658 RepID=UPI00063F79EC|nr:chymotrypsin-2 [Monomorium pharaonis]